MLSLGARQNWGANLKTRGANPNIKTATGLNTNAMRKFYSN